MALDRLIGVILAAGKGSRMAPFSNRYPKPLLPVSNKPIVVHQLEQMRAMGIEEVIIVVGHLGYEIARVLGDGRKHGLEIRFVEQKEILGIAHAVSRLEPIINGRFLLFLGDIFFETEDLTKMCEDMQRRDAVAVLAVKEEANRDAIRRNFAVVENDEGFVKRVIEKPRYTNNNLKGCGLYLFDLPIFDAIRRTPRTAMRDEYEITDSIQILIDYGYPVTASKVVRDDINMSFPHDLLECNLAHLRKSNQDRLVAETSARCLSRFQGSIVGHNVAMSHPIEVRHSLIFDDSRITSTTDLEYVIITPEDMIDCRAHVRAAAKAATA